MERRNEERLTVEKFARYTQILEKTRWASDFSWQHIKTISRFITPVMAKQGAVVFKEGDLDKSLGIIVKGSIDIIKDNKKVTTLNNSQTFGEMALIDGEPRSATGIAREETVIFFIREVDLIRLTEEDPKLGIKLLWKIGKLISQRLRFTTGRLVDYMGDPGNPEGEGP